MSNSSAKNLIGIIIASFAVPVLAIFLLVKLVSTTTSADSASSAMSNEAVVARIQPVGISKASIPVAPGARTGEQVFTAICISCHGTGAAGSPKFGDAAAWAPRIAKGFQTLVEHATKGFNAMPARGGSPDLTNEEVERAVAYMANKGGASFTEPKVAAAGAAPGAAEKVDPAKGKEIYSQVCVACHGTGAAGAPKFGDKAAWAPRIAQGVDALVASAIKGKNAMPPKGTYSGSDAEFRTAVEYMVGAAK